MNKTKPQPSTYPMCTTADPPVLTRMRFEPSSSICSWCKVLRFSILLILLLTKKSFFSCVSLSIPSMFLSRLKEISRILERSKIISWRNIGNIGVWIPLRWYLPPGSAVTRRLDLTMAPSLTDWLTVELTCGTMKLSGVWRAVKATCRLWTLPYLEQKPGFIYACVQGRT